MIQMHLPEFISSCNLEPAPRRLVRVQPDDLEYLNRLAKDLTDAGAGTVTAQDALRYAVECGIAALQTGAGYDWAGS